MEAKIMYLARTSQEQADLEKKMEHFLGHYTIKGAEEVLVKRFANSEDPEISPMPGRSTKEISIERRGEQGGSLLDTSSIMATLELDKYTYYIRYAVE